MNKTSSTINDERFTIDYFTQHNPCRFCWCQDAKNEIALTKLEITEENLNNNLLDIIRDTLDISLTPESIPNKVCQACLVKIENFHSFKSLCIKADKKLQELFSNVEIKRPVMPLCDVKLENDDINLETSSLSKSETVFDYLDTQYTSDNASEDETLFEVLKKQSTKTKVKIKQKKLDTIKCCICFRVFKTKQLYTEHNATYHGVEINGFRCFGCDKMFKTRRGRVGHEANFCKHLKDGFKCAKCDKKLPSRGMYEKHMNNHRKNGLECLTEDVLKCKKCEQRFDTVEELKRHKDVHSSRKRKYICETCGKVFTRHDYLYKHKQTHSGAKQHECPTCGYRTSQRSSLTTHIRKHTGERPFACDLCPQQCITSSNLRAHRRRHLGLKEFQCTICNKKFGYKTSLEDHFTSCHDRSQSHPCSLCSAKYTRVRGLRRHMLAKHSNEAETRHEKEKVTDEKTAPNSNLETSNDVEFFVKNALVKMAEVASV